MPVPPPPEETRQRRDWLAEQIGLDIDEKEGIYLSVASSATLKDWTYWIEILLSAGIATLGLVLNSPAVIIGAMLISPLMGPILAAGLSLAAGDFILALRSMTSVILSSLVAILFSTTLIVFLPFREMTPEIATRTSPTTLDLVVALFSGAVGALAMCKRVKGIATSLPGVAIAVALMPPLCVSGYGLGVFITFDRVQGMSVMRGGGLLYVTNLVAIIFSAMLVFLALHIDNERVRLRIREWRRFDSESVAWRHMLGRFSMPSRLGKIGGLPGRVVLVVAAIVLILVPLRESFSALKREIALRQRTNEVQRDATNLWQEMFGSFSATGQPRSVIDAVSAARTNGIWNVEIRAFTRAPVAPPEREHYLNALEIELGRKINLSLIEIPTSDVQAQARAQVPIVPAPSPPPSPVQLLTELRTRIDDAVSRVTMPPGRAVLDHQLVLDVSAPQLTFSYLGDEDLSADAQSMIAAQIRQGLLIPNLSVAFERTPISWPLGTPRNGSSREIAQVIPRITSSMVRHQMLYVDIAADGETIAQIRDALIAAGVDAGRVAVDSGDPQRNLLRLHAVHRR